MSDNFHAIGGHYSTCQIQFFYIDINCIEEKRDRLPDIIHSSESNLGITLHSVSNVKVAEKNRWS
jgi:hypothetical protein